MTPRQNPLSSTRLRVGAVLGVIVLVVLAGWTVSTLTSPGASPSASSGIGQASLAPGASSSASPGDSGPGTRSCPALGWRSAGSSPSAGGSPAPRTTPAPTKKPGPQPTPRPTPAPNAASGHGDQAGPGDERLQPPDLRDRRARRDEPPVRGPADRPDQGRRQRQDPGDRLPRHQRPHQVRRRAGPAGPGLPPVAFKTNGRFYVYYNQANGGNAGNIMIARYTAAHETNVANAGSAKLMISPIPHTQFGNHNGGDHGLRAGRAALLRHRRRRQRRQPDRDGPEPELVPGQDAPDQRQQRHADQAGDLGLRRAQPVALVVRLGDRRHLDRRCRPGSLRGDRPRQPGPGREQHRGSTSAGTSGRGGPATHRARAAARTASRCRSRSTPTARAIRSAAP